MLGVEVDQVLEVPDVVLDEGDVFLSMCPDGTILVDDASVLVFKVVVASGADGL